MCVCGGGRGVCVGVCGWERCVGVCVWVGGWGGVGCVGVIRILAVYNSTMWV